MTSELVSSRSVYLHYYDGDTKKWMAWYYFRNFLEGEQVTVAMPKNRGGNKVFNSDAPVFLAAPQEIALHRGKKRDDYETEQMASMVKYIRPKHTFEDHERKEADSCGHCGARVYLEGLCAAHATSSSVIAAPTGPQPSIPKKRRLSAANVVKEFTCAKALEDAGLLSSPELRDLKDRLLQGS